MAIGRVVQKKDREYKKLKGMDVEGTLKLKPSGTTKFTVFFAQKPMLPNLNRVEGTPEGEDLPLGLRLISRTDCKTCHNTYVATVGPAYVEVAKRYRNTEDNVLTLISKVKSGGAGNWGEAAMTPHADLPDGDIRHMVEWIMSLDALEEADEPIASGRADLQLREGAEGIEEGEMFAGAVSKVYQYKKSLTKLTDLEPFPQPIYEGIVPELHAEAKHLGELTDNFAIVTEGYLKIPKDNNYTFRLISDDGSDLHIDGQLVIDHDGLHGNDAKDGEVALKAGYHPFRIAYF